MHEGGRRQAGTPGSSLAHLQPDSELKPWPCQNCRNFSRLGARLPDHDSGRELERQPLAGTRHPAISGPRRRLLTCVSCPRPARCIAAGGCLSPSGKAFVLAGQRNGTARRLASIRSPDLAFSYLHAVSCPAAARCAAAGERGVQLTSAYRRDGARWLLLRSRNP